jgi:DNA-binding PadR family transcriptional regulator
MRLSVRKIKRGMLRYLVIEALSTKAMYAYEIIKYIQDKFNGIYKPSPGSIYPILKTLHRKGLINIKEIDGKKIYELTNSGFAEFNKIKEEYKDIFPVDPNSKIIISLLFNIGFLIYKYGKYLDKKDYDTIKNMLNDCKENLSKYLIELKNTKEGEKEVNIKVK